MPEAMLGDEDRGEDEQHDLDPVEAAGEDERRHGRGGKRNAEVAGTPPISSPAAMPTISAAVVPRFARIRSWALYVQPAVTTEVGTPVERCPCRS